MVRFAARRSADFGVSSPERSIAGIGGTTMSDRDQTDDDLIADLELGEQQAPESQDFEPGQDLRAPQSAEGEMKGAPSPGVPHRAVEQPVRISRAGQWTETIDLSALFTKDITTSGSFDIRGEIWRTTFGRMLQALPIAALLVEQNLSVTAANEACKTISPDYEDILGSPFCDLFPTESTRSKALSVIQAVFEDRRPRVFSGVLKLHGNKIWGRATLRSVRIMTERLVLVLLENLTRETKQLIVNQKYQKALQKEIGERKVYEAALKESEARFHQIYDQAPVMMLALDRGGTIRSGNAKCSEGLGYSRAELLGQKMDLILSEESRTAFAKFFDELWRVGEAHDLSYRYLKKDRTMIEALVDSVVMEDPAWGPVALLTIRDVTHELWLEKQLREAQKMEALGTLAGGVAHDFNNLLQVISGYAELIMLRMDLDSPNYPGIRAIREAARRGAELVKQVLTFSRRVESSPRPLDLNHEVLKAAQLLERTLPKMISIDLDLAEALDVTSADPVQVEQILLNLAINAKDAMPEGGRLVIGTQNVLLDEAYCRNYPEVQPGQYVCLSVSDTGHGMETEVLEHIFEPFFSTKKPGEGTGLGLSTVFGLVKMHGGHITCDSHPGKGTIFRIYFPATDQQARGSFDLTGEMPAFGTETILFVDDEEFVRTWGKELLSHAGYTVLDAANGREGLQVYQTSKEQISLVILDLMMPEMGGRECLEKLLQVDDKVKVIIASGLSTDPKTREFLESHARAIVVKPFRSKELLQVVRRVLDSD
jgi:PAS domain S-box-containing protein